MKNSRKDENIPGATISTPLTINDSDASPLPSPSPPPPPSDQSIFEEGEPIIANHKGYYYLAKVEKVEFDKDWKYFIHYMGWNKRCMSNSELPVDHQSNNWDEWLGIEDLLKQTEENLKKVSHDTKKTTDKYANVGRIPNVKLATSSGPSEKKPKNTSVSRKRKGELTGNKDKDNDSMEKLVNLSIPHTLKKQLIDDFEFINQMDKLVRLPRTPSVDAIIEKYRYYRAKKEGVVSESAEEVLSGLRVYFNKALPILLLYNKERQQYQETFPGDLSCPSPSAIYGAEHLLRLFVKLPTLLNELNIEEETVRQLQQNLLDFLKFLQKNQAMFFLSSY